MERFEQDDRELTPDEQDRIIALAARLQSESLSRQTFSDLQRAASEAGIDPEHLQAAYRQVVSEPRVIEKKEVMEPHPRSLIWVLASAVLGLLLMPTVADFPNVAMMNLYGVVYCFLLPIAIGMLRRTRLHAAGMALPFSVCLMMFQRAPIDAVVPVALISVGIALSASTLRYHTNWDRVSNWLRQNPASLADRYSIGSALLPVGFAVMGFYHPVVWFFGFLTAIGTGILRGNSRGVVEGALIMVVHLLAMLQTHNGWAQPGLMAGLAPTMLGGAICASLGVAANWLIRNRTTPRRQPSFY